MFLRWEILRGWMPAIVFAAIAVAIEVLYFNYMVSRGMMDEAFTISLGALKIPLSIALFFSLANAIVLLTLWMSVFENTAFVMAGLRRHRTQILKLPTAPKNTDPAPAHPTHPTFSPLMLMLSEVA